MKQNPMFNPRLLAHAVNQQLVPQRVDLVPVYRSLENQGVTVQISHTGVLLTRHGEVLYRDGTYTPCKAIGREKCAEMRLRQLKMLKWALSNFRSRELENIEGWINGQLN